jgi:hypothetical protein
MSSETSFIRAPPKKIRFRLRLIFPSPPCRRSTAFAFAFFPPMSSQRPLWPRPAFAFTRSRKKRLSQNKIKKDLQSDQVFASTTTSVNAALPSKRK